MRIYTTTSQSVIDQLRSLKHALDGLAYASRYGPTPEHERQLAAFEDDALRLLSAEKARLAMEHRERPADRRN